MLHRILLILACSLFLDSSAFAQKEVQGSLRKFSGPIFASNGGRIMEAVAEAGGKLSACSFASSPAKWLCFDFPQMKTKFLLLCKDAARHRQFFREFFERQYECYVFGDRQEFSRKLHKQFRDAGLL